MRSYKCKKSVFCICFFIFFLIGTICGLFCFRCQLVNNGRWMLSVCETAALSLHTAFVKHAAVLLRPCIVVSALAFHPVGYRLLFPVIFVRGFLMSYHFAALWLGNCDIFRMVLLGLLALPLFCVLCGWAFLRWNLSDF